MTNTQLSSLVQSTMSLVEYSQHQLSRNSQSSHSNYYVPLSSHITQPLHRHQTALQPLPRIFHLLEFISWNASHILQFCPLLWNSALETFFWVIQICLHFLPVCCGPHFCTNLLPKIPHKSCIFKIIVLRTLHQSTRRVFLATNVSCMCMSFQVLFCLMGLTAH